MRAAGAMALSLGRLAPLPTMKAFSSDRFVLPLPPGHRFPMDKYRRLHQRVAGHADAWDVTIMQAEPVDERALRRTHDAAYVARMLRGEGVDEDMRRIGFPWSPELIMRSRCSAGATCEALRTAVLGEGVAVNLAGGTHHAGPGRGGGYCVFNDSVIAVRTLRSDRLIRRALVIDLDVHQGDGTAELCAGDPDTFTFSMHGARNYPARKPASDWDIALPDGCGDEEYLDRLTVALDALAGRARPDAVLYLAGADPFEGDRLGRLALSKTGLAQRDELVLGFAARHGLPMSVAMAGGYAEEVDDIVDIHLETVCQAAVRAASWQRRPDARSNAGLAG